MRTISTLMTPCILSMLCACTPGSNNIGETLTTEAASDPGGSGSDSTTGTTGAATQGGTEGMTGGTADLATSTGATAGETTSETTSESSGGTTDVDTTGDSSTTAGETTEDTGGGMSFDCGPKTCDANNQYCAVFIPGVMGAEITYTCEQIPARCNDAPSCGCLPDGDAPQCQCTEDIGFKISCAGA